MLLTRGKKFLMTNDIIQELKNALRNDRYPYDETVYVRAIEEIERLKNACATWEHIARLYCKADYIESLQKVGDLLVSVMKSGSDSHWDETIDLWEELRNTHSKLNSQFL